jgi:hypothetical protein
MIMNPILNFFRRRFVTENRGSVSIETLIMVPMLFWAMIATVVFFDGFRSRNQTQMAAQTVADLLSRSTDAFTTNYLEGMNDVFDFLADSRYPTRLRVSSVMWNSAQQVNALQWSYGTRGFSALPAETFLDLANNDMDTLIARFGAASGFNFGAAAAQAPIPELAQRIPPVLPGEALILVETFAMWSPFANVGVGQIRFNPVVVTRPRFSPWINLEGADELFPESDYEVTFVGYTPALPPPVPEPEPEPVPQFQPTVTSQTFDGPAPAGWSHTPTTTTTRPGIGTFLGPFGGETWDAPVTFAANLGMADLASARIEFDLLIIDSWDHYDTTHASVEGDVLSILINGTPIALDAFAHNVTTGVMTNTRTATVNMGGSVYTTTLTRTAGPANMFGSGSWTDDIWRVTIDIQAPPQNFNLGFRARLNSGISDESFGIDNLVITRAQGTRTPAAFIPNPATLLGTDPHTRFPVHSGCPDHRLSANWVTLRASQIGGGFGFQRRARGATRVTSTQCPGMLDYRHAHASPTLVFNYTHDVAQIDGNRLRLRTEDGNNGNTCDATLIVRDPNGQFWFNDDISSSNYNARLNMGHPPTGVYHVWIGHFASNACNTQFRIERY